MIDADTKAWIRNASDEKAAAAGCRFDAERGQFVVDWIQRYCRLYEGQRGPMILADWQLEATMRLFGWVRWAEKLPSGGPPRWVRRFTKASVWIPKKNGKTPTAAAWALYLLAGDGEDGNHVFFAAADGGQARIAAKHALEMVKASPELEEVIGVNLNEMKLTHWPSLSDAKPISSGDTRAAQAKQGLNGCVVIDELHVISARFVSESSIDQAGISRDEPLMVAVSTAGKDPDGYGRKQYEYGRAVAAGEIDDQRCFFLCYEAPEDLSDEDLDADPLKYARMANPSLGRILQEDEFVATYKEKKAAGLAALADFKTFRLNIWQRTASPWVRPTDWTARRAAFAAADMDGMTCCAGLDLAKTHDMTALALCFPLDAETFRLLVKFWLPEAGLRRLAALVPEALEWAAAGLIEVTPGDVTHYAAIKKTFAEWVGRYHVEEVVFDPHQAEQITQEWVEEHGVERFAFYQTVRYYNEPLTEMERLIIKGGIEHDGNAVLTWQVGHTNVETQGGYKRPAKPDHNDHKKIDGVAAMLMAFAGARKKAQDENWYRAGTLRD